MTEIPPLVVEFTVAVPPAAAFHAWVEEPIRWWPAGHTRSGAPQAIVVEPRVGGRVYEVDGAGAEHDWARVVGWDPPHELRLAWHHVFPPSEATDLRIEFHDDAGDADDAGATTVRIVQSGWERLGDAEGTARRRRTVDGWTGLSDHYRRHLERGAGDP